MSGRDGGAEATRGLRDWVDEVRGTALRDEAFWTRQRAGIRGRLDVPGTRRWAWALALGASVATAAVAIVMTGRGPSGPVTPGVPATVAVETASDDDDQLLVEVEIAVMREVPLAYEAVDFQWNGARDPEAD
mgnify:CR=1 FL=1